jgi:cytochrome c2
MVFQGVSDPQDVADLLAYIRTLADSPAPLPN